VVRLIRPSGTYPPWSGVIEGRNGAGGRASSRGGISLKGEWADVRKVPLLFAESGFKAFKSAVAAGSMVRVISARSVTEKPRPFFDRLVEFARSVGSKVLAYLV
jgi:hypothetical protein